VPLPPVVGRGVRGLKSARILLWPLSEAKFAPKLPGGGPKKPFWRTFTPSTRWVTLARSWRPPRGPQGAWEAVLVDPSTGAARVDAWSAARGLWSWCASRARPADPDDRLQAHASRARRSKRTRHPSLARDDSSLRCAGGAAVGEPMWLWCRRCRHHLWLPSRRPVGCGGARRGHGGDAE